MFSFSTALAQDAVPPASTPVNATLNAGLRKMLLAGIPDMGLGNLSDARRLYMELRRLAPTDSRLEYCHGLVLLHHGKGSEASIALDTARGSTAQFSFAAHRLFVTYKLAAGKPPEAAAALEKMVAAIATSNGRSSELERLAAAKWLGRVIGFYSHIAPEDRLAIAVRQQAESFDSRLTGEVLAAYRAGVAAIRQEHAELANATQSEAQALEEKAQLQRESRQEKVFAAKDGAKIEKGQLESASAELATKQQQRLEEIDKELTLRMEAIQKRMAEFQYWETLRKKQLLKMPVGYSEERVNSECFRLEQECIELQNQVNDWTAQRQQADVQFKRASSQAKDRSRAIASAEKKLDRTAKVIKNDVDIAERAAKNKLAQLKQLRTYVRPNLREERDTVLGSLD